MPITLLLSIKNKQKKNMDSYDHWINSEEKKLDFKGIFNYEEKYKEIVSAMLVLSIVDSPMKELKCNTFTQEVIPDFEFLLFLSTRTRLVTVCFF